MTKTTEQPKIAFSIRSIRELSFCIEQIEGMDLEELEMEFSMEIEFKPESDQIDITPEVSLFQEKEMVLKSRVKSSFELKNLVQFLTEEGQKRQKNLSQPFGKEDFAIPDPVMATFLGISITHLRAILAHHTNGTTFEPFIFPLVNPKKLVEEVMHASD